MNSRNIILVTAFVVTCYSLNAQNANKAVNSAAQDMNNPKWSSPAELEEFIKKLKSLKVNEDDADTIASKIGDPEYKTKADNYTFWHYHAYITDTGYTNVNLLVGNNNGKLLRVTVNDGSGNLIYQVGETPSQEPAKTNSDNTLQSKPLPPEKPLEGQLYFNTSDKHFYGWNGKEWKQLDK
jgi:hypothetical protein